MTMPGTDFNVPRGSFPTPIDPIGVGPLEGPLVKVAFNYQWCKVIVGCLSQLLLNTTWNVDTPEQLTSIQESVFDLMASFCVAPPPADSQIPSITWDASDMTGIRVDCNCRVFVTCCDGTEVELATLKQAQSAPVQPGSGSEQPQPNGGCVTYHVVLDANNKWLAPFFVNSGDTITAANAKGAWNDGTVSPWHCPDGSTFLAGACIGGGGGFSGDPDPSVNHMAVIGELSGGLFFPFLAGPVTLPGGIVAQNLWFRANDSILDDNLGSIEFDVTICNEQSSSWSHNIDLTLTPGGWFYQVDPGQTTVNPSVWAGGTGWTNGYETGSGANNATLRVRKDFGQSVHIDTWTVNFDVANTNATDGPHSCSIQSLDSGGSPTVLAVISPTVNGTNQAMSAPAAFDAFGLVVELQVSSENVPTVPTGTSRFFSLSVAGTGFDPFV